MYDMSTQKRIKGGQTSNLIYKNIECNERGIQYGF